MQDIDIPNSVTSIGNVAFGGCTSLKKINIPNSVSHIGNDAFSNCQCTLALGFIYNDAINNFERISDHCSNIAMAVLEANDARLLPHAYLHALEETGEEGYRSQLAIYQEKYLSQFTSAEV